VNAGTMPLNRPNRPTYKHWPIHYSR